MISPNLGNRLIFVLSLLGFAVSAFLFYEYNLSGPIFCPTGAGCDIVRASSYSNFFGIPVPILGIIFYLMMAFFAIFRSHYTRNKLLFNLQFLGSVTGVIFGAYLTFLELFVIKAICFWCVTSFIISILLLLSVILDNRNIHENGN